MSSELSSNSSEDNALHQTDAQVFARLQNGETDALAILYDRHASLVYGISIALLKNQVEAEDLTQDIFLSLAKNSAYDPQRGSLRTYLGILTRSRALDRLRKYKRRQQKLHNQASNENAKVVSETPMVEITQLERSSIVQSALEQLSTKEREVLQMAYYQGLSQSEIAQHLDIALGTIKSRSRRGLLKLRQALSDLRGES